MAIYVESDGRPQPGAPLSESFHETGRRITESARTTGIKPGTQDRIPSRDADGLERLRRTLESIRGYA